MIGDPIEITLDANDKIAHLVVEPGLAAADESAVVRAVVPGEAEKRIAPAILCPGAADVAAEVESGPGERWREVRGSRRGPHGQVGGASEPGSERKCQQCESRDNCPFHACPSTLAPHADDPAHDDLPCGPSQNCDV